MNYIKEINAFMDWLEINPLDATTQTLWFHIMAIANKSGWPEWFTIANLTLMAKVGISENTLIKHRNILIQKKRIEYRNQGRQKAGKYKIIPFTSNFEVKPRESSNVTSNFEVNREVNRAVKCEVNPSALYKLNKTKQIDNDDNNSRPGFVDVYEQEFGQLMTPGTFEQLNAFRQDGMSDEVIAEAIKRAAINGVYTTKYITAILEAWRKQNVADLAGVRRVDAEYEKKRRGGQKPNGNPKRNTEEYDYDQFFSA